MKLFLTAVISLISLVSVGQSDIKFDIMIKSLYIVDGTYTTLVDYDKPDTCYIHVITNDTTAINVLKNTYLLDRYEVKGSRYTFFFPKKSSARILTNLAGAKVPFKVDKVTQY